MNFHASPRLITHEFWPFRGGVASFCRDVAHGFVQRGGRPIVHAPLGSTRATNHQFPFEVEHYPGSSRLTPAGLWAARRAWNELLGRDARPIVLGSYGAIAGAVLGSPIPNDRKVAVVLHGSEIFKWRRTPLLGWKARRLLASCRAVFCNSAFTRNRLCALWPEAAEWSLRVLSLGPGTTALGQVQAWNPDPLGRIRILLLARVHPRKGQVEFLRACGMLRKEERQKLVVQIAGTGLPEHLLAVQRAAKVQDVTVEMLGEIADEDLPTIYAQCDLYALTPVTLDRSVEGFGMTFLEAGAHGKAVIGYRSGGVSEAVMDGVTGCLVDEGDIEGLAAVIRRLVNDEDLRRRMGAASLERARSRTWERVAAEMEAGWTD